MKKFLIAAALATLVAGGAELGVSQAAGKPGPNGHNDFGLCTAAQHGNKNGWTDGALPPPFAGAPDGSDEGDAAGGRQDFIDAFCDPMPTPGGK